MSNETVAPFDIYRECQTGELKEHLKPTPVRGMTTAERQAKFRQKQLADGKVTVSALVNIAQAADVYDVLRILKANPNLLPVCTFRDMRTGRMVKVPTVVR